MSKNSFLSIVTIVLSLSLFCWGVEVILGSS